MDDIDRKILIYLSSKEIVAYSLWALTDLGAVNYVALLHAVSQLQAAFAQQQLALNSVAAQLKQAQDTVRAALPQMAKSTTER